MCVIETTRLALKRLTPDDAAFMLGLLNQPSFLENIGDRGVRTLEQARVYIANGAVASYERHGFGLYLVVVKETGEVDIGFAFLPKHWGKGYAVESAAAVKVFAWDVARLSRLVAITSPENWPSIRVLEKVGLVFEKMVRLSPEGEELKLFSCKM